MRLVSLDAETYWSADYTLSKMTTEAYVRDPRFEMIGISVSIDQKPPVWMEEAQWRAFTGWSTGRRWRAPPTTRSSTG
jgi:hypothetical protein